MPLTESQDRIYTTVVELGEQSHDGDSTVALNPEGTVGLSWGGVQVTQSSGNLGLVLDRANRSFPLEFAALFGPHHEELLRVTGAASLAPVGGQVLWSPWWAAKFRAAGKTTWARASLKNFTFGEKAGFWPATVDICEQLGLTTERSYALVMDRCVNGGPNRARRAAAKAVQHEGFFGFDEPRRIGVFVSYALEYVRGGKYEDTITTRTWRVYGDKRLKDTALSSNYA